VTEPTQALRHGEDEPTYVAARYRLDALIGRGGTAEVWRAEDSSLGRAVALKLVTVPTDDSSARAGEEARLLARLSHPGLVPVYDAGNDERGRPWVVMELVLGETLADLIQRGPLDSQRTAGIGASIASALAYVHAQGLVHRDVKPGNVLLGDDGRVRLTDFGIARLVDSARVTSTGMMVGTASYLAPEQVRGETVGPPADVYALGLVLLECLTGRREYSGSTIEVALARLERQPVVPADLPAGWPGLLRAMTARAPDDRPSPQNAAADLSAIAAGGQATTLLARTPPPADPTRALPRTSAAPQPAPRPAAARRPPAQPERSPWRYVALLVAVIAALVGGLLIGQALQGDGTLAPLPTVGPNVPQPLQGDLQQLRDAADQAPSGAAQ